jgi:hypothetical protein
MQMSSKWAALAAVLALAAAGLSGCVTPTPYQPLVKGTSAAGGYSETRIEPDRWRVTFAGNTATKRETVETYLLFRAAELTLQNGYDWFSVDDRQTDTQARAYIQPDPFYGPWYGGFGYWRPAWRYRGAGFGPWGPWGPWYGGPYYGGGVDVTTIQNFEASAEIMTHKGAKPVSDPRAFDAHAVVENLKPKILYPQAAH